MEVIATGRGAPRQLVQLADLHSEMRAHRRRDLDLDGDLACAQRRLDGIEIYTGEGKGKSTSALGKALQAIGRGISQDKSHRVLILQWLKGGSGYTEDAAIAALRESYPHLVDHLRSGRDAIVWRGQQQPIDYVEAERAWEIARAAISSGLYKTVILDELNPTVDLELLPVEPIVQTLLRKPAETEVIITGRCKNPPAYFDLASVHSEMVCHKHYAERGIDLKRGVDY
jgi:cob(I)alamin adenosyltransferase